MGKFLLLLLGGLLLTACTVTPIVPPVDSTDELKEAPVDPSTLTDHGPAPELQNEVFLNTEKQLRLSELRGQVVLLDMWTFG